MPEPGMVTGFDFGTEEGGYIRGTGKLRTYVLLCRGDIYRLFNAFEADIVVKGERKAEETSEPPRQLWNVAVWLPAHHVDDLLKDR